MLCLLTMFYLPPTPPSLRDVSPQPSLSFLSTSCIYQQTEKRPNTIGIRRRRTPHFDFEDRGLLDLDEMDSREANNSTLKSIHRQSDIDNILSRSSARVLNKRCVFSFLYVSVRLSKPCEVLTF